MGLSNDLALLFAKTVSSKKNTSNESTVFGTIEQIYKGKQYVRLDGSDLLTPVETTADAQIGERVTVLIKNHTATIMGNLSSPAARTDTVTEISNKANAAANKVSEFDIILANVVTTDVLNAQIARIDTLQADNIIVKDTVTANNLLVNDIKTENIVIRERLTASEGSIQRLNTTKLDAKIADILYATIEDLEATNADIYNLEATYANFEQTTTKRLNAIDATIGNLDSTYATITELDAERARIDVLEAGHIGADSAYIKELKSDIAEINALIFGSATGDVIQTTFSNSVIAQLGDAQIKSAMIESVSAGKITAGDIITNNVRVKSEDGTLLISDETIQISDDKRVRVQIGKDGNNDYSINIWDDSGNLMFSKGGITDSAIKDAIIRNDMVSDTANIAAHKLDIDSLFEEINGSKKTISSSKILFSDTNQTLDVKFEKITSDVGNLQNGFASQETALSVIQGQISSKIWQQDITNSLSGLNTQYSTLNQTVNSMSSTVAEHSALIASKADIVVGGRNMIENSDFSEDTIGPWRDWGDAASGTREKVTISTHPQFTTGITIEKTSAGQWGYAQDNIPMIVGETYVLSAWFKVQTVNGKVILMCQKGNDNDGWTTSEIDATEVGTSKWYRLSHKFTAVSPNTHIYIGMQGDGSGKVTFTGVQLEKGTVVSDWSPYSRGTSVGGINLLRGTRNFDNAYWATNGGTRLNETIEGGGVYKVSGAWNDLGYYKLVDSEIELNTDYTISWYAKSSSDAYLPNMQFYCSDGTIVKVRRYGQLYGRQVTTEWKRYSHTFQFIAELTANTQLRIEPSTASTDPSNAYLLLGAFKLEKGSKATGYAPSPLDVDARITSAESSITQLSDRITSNVAVTDSLGSRMSTVEQTASGLEVRLGDLGDIAAKSYSFSGANGAVKWVRLGTLVSKDDASNFQIELLTGDGYNGSANQNSRANIVIKDGWQSTRSTDKAFGVSVLRENCESLIIKVLATEHNTCDVWCYLPWTYWNGTYTISGARTSWTHSIHHQDNEPTNGTAQNVEYRINAHNASKSATNYMSYDSTNGLLIGNKSSGSWSGYRAQILPAAFNILDSSGTKLASYGSTVTIGKDSAQNVYIDSDSVDIRKGSTILASFADKLIKLGVASKDATIDLCGGAGQIKASSINNNSVFDSMDISSTYLSLSGSSSASLKSVKSTIDGEIGVFQGNNVSGDHVGNYTRSTINSHTRNTSHASYAMVETISYENYNDANVLLIASDEKNSKHSSIRVYPDQVKMESKKLDLLVDSVAVSGLTTFAQTITANGSLVANGTVTLNNGVEISHATPYIDFHFGKDTSDYTTRIIENEKGVLTLSGGLKVTKVLTAASLNVNSGTHFFGHTYLEQSGTNEDTVGIYGELSTGVYREMMRMGGSSTAPILIIGDGLYVNKLGTTHIGSGTGVTLLTANNRLAFYDTTGYDYTGIFRPNAKAKCVLGAASYTWHTIYAANATIQTSDRREKENILPLGESPIATFAINGRSNTIDIHSELFDRLQPVQYNFIDGNGRTCYGLVAQDVIDAMDELGIGENELDLIHHDFYIDEETGEEKETYGLAYANLIALLIHEVQKLKAKVSELSN